MPAPFAAHPPAALRRRRRRPRRSAPAQPAPQPAAGRIAGRQFGLDAPLFYQLLIGEIELRSGEAGTAYEVCSTRRAARATSSCSGAPSTSRCRRAPATRRWPRRGPGAQALPESVDALRYQVQLLVALNRSAETVEPLRRCCAAHAGAERPALIAALPRLLQRAAATERAMAALLDAGAAALRASAGHAHRRAASRIGRALARRAATRRARSTLARARPGRRPGAPRARRCWRSR